MANKKLTSKDIKISYHLEFSDYLNWVCANDKMIKKIILDNINKGKKHFYFDYVKDYKKLTHTDDNIVIEVASKKMASYMGAHKVVALCAITEDMGA